MLLLKSTIKHCLIFSAIFSFLFLGASLHKTQATSASEIQALIDSLQSRIDRMQAEQPTVYRFERNLYFGMKGDSDVRRLQNYLISKRILAESANTGNFFTLTREAVKRYQASVGVSATGYFGPLTRAKVNAELELLRQAQVPRTPNPPPAPPNEPPAVEPQTAEPTPQSPLPPAPTPSEPPATPPAPPTTPPERTGNAIDPKPAYNLDRIGMLVQEYVNKERWSNGLAILIWDDSLARTALLHSLDQAADNGEITNSNIHCHYPMIRHEGIRGGYSLSDRLRDGGVSYRSAGENIVMFSTSKNLIFQYERNNPPAECKEVPKFTPGEGTKEERLALFQSILNMALDAVRGLRSLDWVNNEWLTEDEIAKKAVDLWMNSPGHRANILRTYFSYGGIGIAQVNDYFIITHHFAGR